jgi:hypothetical protein
MPVNHHAADEPALPGAPLVESLECWRDADRSADSEVLVPAFRVLEAHRLVVEQAKGALMMRYGLDPYQAFAVLVRWARVTHVPVVSLAEVLVHGICERHPRTERRQGALLRWLEQQLLNDTPDLAPLPIATPVRPVA